LKLFSLSFLSELQRTLDKMTGTNIYEVLENKIKSLGQDNPDAISDKDVEALVKINPSVFSEGDAAQFIALRKINQKTEKKKLLAIPELPADHTLTPPEFQKFKSGSTPLTLTLPGDLSKAAKEPIPFEDLDAAEWLKIAIDCNVLYGHIFSKLGQESEDIVLHPIFLPPNTSLFGTENFRVSQQSLSYHAESQRSEHYSSKCVMTNIGGGVSVQSPFVSGSIEYSHETKNREVQKGTKVTSMCKVEFPVGIFTLPMPGEMTTSSIKLNENFIKHAEDLINQTPILTKEEFSEKLCQSYGDIVPRNVTIGVASYTTKTEESEESQKLEEVSNSFKSSIKGAYGNIGGGISGHAGRKTSKGEGGKKEKVTYTFTAIAGSLPDPTNPMSIADCRLKPGSWRTINLGSDFTPVVDYLPNHLKAKLHSLPGKGPRRSDQMFGDIKDYSLYAFKVAKDGNFVAPRVVNFPGSDIKSYYNPKNIEYTIDVKQIINADKVAVTMKFDTREYFGSGQSTDMFLNINNDELVGDVKFAQEFIIERFNDVGGIYIKVHQGDSDEMKYLNETLSCFKLSSIPQPFQLGKEILKHH